MTQIATVEKLLPGGYAEISVPRKTACGHDCEECAGCGMTGASVYAEARDPVGVRPGDKVAILAEGSNAWIISELGLFYAGAVSVPLSVKLEESNDLLFRLRHAEVRAIFVSKYQLPKIRRIRAEFPDPEQRRAVLNAQGGVSFAACIGAFILLMLVGSLCSMLLGPDLNALVGTFI